MAQLLGQLGKCHFQAGGPIAQRPPSTSPPAMSAVTLHTWSKAASAGAGLGFGRIVASDIDVPNMLANLVYEVDERWMSASTKRQCDRAPGGPLEGHPERHQRAGVHRAGGRPGPEQRQVQRVPGRGVRTY